MWSDGLPEVIETNVQSLSVQFHFGSAAQSLTEAGSLIVYFHLLPCSVKKYISPLKWDLFLKLFYSHSLFVDIIPKSLLANVGGPELFKCNYDIGHLNLSKCLQTFYHEIITFWQDVIASNPKSKNDVLEQIVWNNKFIKSDKKSMYLQHWRYAGILKINDLFDTQQNCFPSFDSFRNKFNVRCNFLQYFSLVNAIPQSWKKLLNCSLEQSSTPQILMEEMTCKKFFDQSLRRLVRKDS